jgi:hypothetical protein
MLNAIARTRPIRSPSQPKNTPPVGCPDEKHGDDGAEPLRGLRRRRRTEQVVQGRTADEREEAHFKAVEHPSEQGSRQRHPAAKVGFGALRRRVVVPIFGAVSSNAGASIGLMVVQV